MNASNYQFSRTNPQHDEYINIWDVIDQDEHRVTHLARWNKNRTLRQWDSSKQANLTLMYQSPILRMEGNEIAFLGEVDKWTRVSPDRFIGIDHGQNQLIVSMVGVPFEVVNLGFSVRSVDPATPQDVGDKIISVSCKFESSGKAIVTFKPNTNGKPLLPDISCISE